MARNQPTFDFLAGGEPSPARRERVPFRESMKQSTACRADISNEDVRAQLRTAQYELDSLKQERELNELRHQQELREVQNRAEADFKRAQAAEAASSTASKKADALSRAHQETQDRAANETLKLEKEVRSLQDDNRSLRDELEEARADLESAGRQSRRALVELEQKYVALNASFEECQRDLGGRVAALQAAQQKLARKEAEVGALESEVLRLKAQTGDLDTLAVVKKELAEQVSYIKKLESTNRDQLAELKQNRSAQKSMQIVEEEKRALEAKVHMLGDLRRQLADIQLQKRILEDEKQGWMSYLEANAAEGDDMHYETPEQMAKALLDERIERASLLDKLGALQPEINVLEQNLQSARQERARLQDELDELRRSATANDAGASSAGDAKARARLERQNNLLTKEVEYLRAQMKTFEAEEAEFSPEHVDEARSKRIHGLEQVVDQYRAEVQTLQADLTRLQAQPTPALQTPRKRAREEDEAEKERWGELKRKTRALQEDVETLHKRNQVLEAELKASVSQIQSLKASSRTRVLEHRDNPTGRMEAIKMSTLTTLRAENAALLSQLESGQPAPPSVPRASLDSLRLQLAELHSQLQLAEKKKARLAQIYASKGAEFREAAAALLGWKLDFLPSGPVKLTSTLHPSSCLDGEDVENSILFDTHHGTMKLSGGPRSPFAHDIRHLVDFWVDGRKDIVCFLAALQLEFYERSTRAQP